MTHEASEYFDLSIILGLGDLDIRHIAETRPSLSVGEYWELLSKCISLAPEVSSALVKFAEFDGDSTLYWRALENMIALLTDLGCNKCVTALYSISHARGKGDWRTAAFQAKKILDDFNSLYTRILTAKRSKMPDAPPVTGLTGDSYTVPDPASSLQEYITYLDDEGARRKLSRDIRAVKAEDDGYRPLILAVDDSPDILAAVSSVLSGRYRVFKLPKPTMLKNVLAQVKPDLFLLDYQMPELNGFECVPIIRSIEGHEETPIIFLTSAGTVDNISTAIALGACDFMVKPFNPDALRKKIAKHIVRKISTP